MSNQLTIICLLLLLCSCNPQSNSSIDRDTIPDKKNQTADTSIGGLDKVADSLKREIGNRTLESNIFEKLLGKWIFVKSFLGEGRSIDSPSFTILKRKIESAGYAYFVHFSQDQEYLLLKKNENTLVYGDGYGTFEYDPSTDHLFVKISETSDAEYQKLQ